MAATIAITVKLPESTCTVELGTHCKINSKASQKKIEKSLAPLFGGPVKTVELKARTSDSGSDMMSIDTFNITVEEFRKKNGEVLVDVKTVNRGLFRRLAALEESHKKLRQETVELEARVGNLEVESEEFSKVALCYLVGKVHAKLQATLRANKPEEESWSSFLGRQFSARPAFFQQHGLGFAELALLAEGHGTPYQEGNDAAHDPDQQLVKRVALRKEAPWAKLWSFYAS